MHYSISYYGKKRQILVINEKENIISYRKGKLLLAIHRKENYSKQKVIEINSYDYADFSFPFS